MKSRFPRCLMVGISRNGKMTVKRAAQCLLAKAWGMLWSLMGNTSMSWGLHISEDSNSLSLTVDFNSSKIAFLKTYLINELKRLRPILGVS